MSDFRIVREFLDSPVVLAVDGIAGRARVPGADLRHQPGAGLGGGGGRDRSRRSSAWLNERATQPPLIAANRSAFGAQQYADGTLRNAQVIEAMGMQRDIHRRWIEKQREFLGLQALASRSRRRLPGHDQVPADHHGLAAARPGRLAAAAQPAERRQRR